MALTVHEETFDGVGGLKIFLRSWRPDGKPRAVIVICHGVNSHGGQYIWAAEQFVKHGFAVYALDLRGRGKSEGERFYVENVADYVSDVAGAMKIAKSRDPGVPVFLLGHSAGGVVSSCLRAREPGRAHRVHLRELRVPGAGAQLRPRRHQGVEPPRSPAAGAQAQERGFLARSESRRGAEQRSADRARSAAGDHGRSASSRRRAAARGVSADYACRCSSCTAPTTRRPSAMAASSSTRQLDPRTRRSSSTRGTTTTSSTTSARKG